jgi:hypothetical protein
MGELIQLEGDSAILQELYDSGIDVSIACMARAGFLVEFRDEWGDDRCESCPFLR